jgi:excisionase family DNA binding protein
MGNYPTIANNLKSLSTEEVAELFGLSIQTIYRLAKEGNIPHVRIGRTLRFLAHELMDWLNHDRKTALVINYSKKLK